ncbi:EAL domain-containing protein [Jeotgalibacillus salarius]|uniref:EAL domain-containing protein n=1 Tax=Jeotgalibacillus salarius TaxID=546023 RepID=A0A4Y8LDI4_9BACL|nr:EAL domain-containing protein [Jeotgalibacillus salarius]TFE00352.1 EAL domain-containing protein [Jeotgalibacillus salarius]
MFTKCVNCGVSIKFADEGTFHLKNVTEQEINRLSFPVIGLEGTYKTGYQSLTQLEEMTGEVTALNKKIDCGISSKNNHAQFMTAELFKTRLENRDTVEFIQDGKLVSHLQPIVNISTGEVYAYESLLRADSSEKNISPYELFQVASHAEMHSLLDQRAREEAIRARKNHIKPGIKSFINFLPSTIYNPEYCLQHTFSVVNKYNVDPADLVFEVVETEKVQDVDHLKKVFQTYKREGMKVALDDVGAGFSTIEMLKLLEPNYVKIDRSYVDRCDENINKQDFLSEVTHVSKELGITVLAEGLERIEELKVCKDIGIDLCQGYLIGKPEPTAKTPIINTSAAS